MPRTRTLRTRLLRICGAWLPLACVLAGCGGENASTNAPMVADAGAAPAFEAEEPEATGGAAAEPTETGPAPLTDDEATQPAAGASGRYADTGPLDLPPLEDSPTGEPTPDAATSGADATAEEDPFGDFLADAYGDLADEGPADEAAAAENDAQPPSEPSAQVDGSSGPLEASDLWPGATPDEPPIDAVVANDAPAADAAPVELSPVETPPADLPPIEPKTPTTAEIALADDPAELWDVEPLDPPANGPPMTDGAAREDEPLDRGVTAWDPPTPPAESDPDPTPAPEPPSTEALLADDAEVGDDDLGLDPTPAERFEPEPPSDGETPGDRYADAPAPLPWDLPAETDGLPPDPEEAVADTPAEDLVEQPAEPDAAPGNPLRDAEEAASVAGAGSGVEPLPAVPVLDFNTRHMAWLMGGKFGLATLAGLEGATTTEVDEWTNEVRRLADELGIETPNALGGSADNPGDPKAGDRVRAALDGAATVGSQLATQHGADHAALFEIALKSNALLVLSREQPDLAGPVGEAVTDAAERARLPSFLWRDSVRALRSDPDAERIAEALERLQQRVEFYLR